jgi:hypothetical protein
MLGCGVVWKTMWRERKGIDIFGGDDVHGRDMEGSNAEGAFYTSLG